eukprot:8023121-Pyramimonas_sp.AAC.1
MYVDMTTSSRHPEDSGQRSQQQDHSRQQHSTTRRRDMRSSRCARERVVVSSNLRIRNASIFACTPSLG